MNASLLKAARRVAAVVAVVALTMAMAPPAGADSTSTTTTTLGPDTTTTTVPTTDSTTTTLATATTTAPPTTVPPPPPPPTTAPSTSTTTTTVPPTTTTLVSPAELAILLGGLTADLARVSAIQAFIQAQAAALARASAAAAAPIPAAGPAADPTLLRVAAAQVAASTAQSAAQRGLQNIQGRMREMALALYVHADASGGAVTADSIDGVATDRTVLLAMLLSQERHDLDGARRQLAVTDKALAAAKAASDRLVAARTAQIEVTAEQALQRAEAAATSTTTTAPTTTVAPHPGTPAPPAAPPSTARPAPPPPDLRRLGPTILGPSVLTGAELAGWFATKQHQPALTVPLLALAAAYQANGVTYGVRDDIAFAQSVLETGYFAFPAGGQLVPTDNNFAGIGACDSCAHGWTFPDASTGVAAQLQLLHDYASAVPVPGPLPGFIGPTGCCPTWMSLTGVWATASDYGYAILTLYRQMLEWAIAGRSATAGL